MSCPVCNLEHEGDCPNKEVVAQMEKHIKTLVTLEQKRKALEQTTEKIVYTGFFPTKEVKKENLGHQVFAWKLQQAIKEQEKAESY